MKDITDWVREGYKGASLTFKTRTIGLTDAKEAIEPGPVFFSRAPMIKLK